MDNWREKKEVGKKRESNIRSKAKANWLFEGKVYS